MSVATELLLIRHGETEWSLSGKHTSYTDLTLTEHGREQAELVAKKLRGENFDRVFVSPLKRAQETCEISGFLENAQVDARLTEWNYGDYEGVTTKTIRESHPSWLLFRDGCPGGESPEDMAARIDGFISEVLALGVGRVAAFSSGHVSRVIGARWAELSVLDASRLYLTTASICTLGFEREVRVLKKWNDTSHLPFVRGH